MLHINYLVAPLYVMLSGSSITNTPVHLNMSIEMLGLVFFLQVPWIVKGLKHRRFLVPHDCAATYQRKTWKLCALRKFKIVSFQKCHHHIFSSKIQKEYLNTKWGKLKQSPNPLAKNSFRFCYSAALLPKRGLLSALTHWRFFRVFWNTRQRRNKNFNFFCETPLSGLSLLRMRKKFFERRYTLKRASCSLPDNLQNLLTVSHILSSSTI